MAPFHANSFIDALTDPKTGDVEKQLSLLYLGMDMMDLNEKLQEARSHGVQEHLRSESTEKNEYQPGPWWKLW